LKSGKTTILLTLFLIFTWIAGPALAATTRIVVKPFTIEAEEPYPFLEKGIFKMLFSRLQIPGTSRPMLETDPEAGTADYVLTGNILIFGEGISTDARLVDAKTGAPVLSFNRLGETKGDALAHVNMLADEIKSEVLGITSGAKAAPQATEQPAVEDQARIRGEEPTATLWRSQTFDEGIISLALADVTGDGRNETVIASRSSMTLMTREGKALKKIAAFETGMNLEILTVDAGDINGNKKAEIYLTCIDQRTKRPSSLVVEWNGTGFTTLMDNDSRLFRVMETKTRGTLLFGQTPRDKDKMLDGQVSQLSWQGNALVESPYKLPGEATLYSFTFGDVMNNGSEAIITLTLDGRIEVFSDDGRMAWKSPEGYGGSANYLEYKGYLYNRNDGFQMSRFFLQQRLFVADLDGDGKNSLIVVKNVDEAGVLKKTRFFSKGIILSLAWDEMGLAPEGRTRSFPGYFSDYTIGDMDNDGKQELVFAISRSEGMVGQRNTSRLYSQDRIAKNAGEFY